MKNPVSTPSLILPSFKKNFQIAEFLLFSLLALGACRSSEKSADVCNDGECTRSEVVQAAEENVAAAKPEGSAPGTITVYCGVFKDGEENPTPCEAVTVQVFVGDSKKLKKEYKMSGEKLVVPEIAAGEKVTLNLMLQGCTKPNLLPSLGGGESRETYFKLPCR